MYPFLNLLSLDFTKKNSKRLHDARWDAWGLYLTVLTAEFDEND